MKIYFITTNTLNLHIWNTELLLCGMLKQNSLPIPAGYRITINNDQISHHILGSYGITVSGVHEILDLMFGNGGIHNYNVKEFPLQDAVEFAHFLMQTQIGVDKYANRIPRVGGEIDIAVIHPISGFKWVKQKELQALIEN